MLTDNTPKNDHSKKKMLRICKIILVVLLTLGFLGYIFAYMWEPPDETIFISSNQIDQHLLDGLDLPELPTSTRWERLLVRRWQWWLEPPGSFCVLTASIPAEEFDSELLENQSYLAESKGRISRRYAYSILETSTDRVYVNFYWGVMANSAQHLTKGEVYGELQGFNTREFSLLLFVLVWGLLLVLAVLPYDRLQKGIRGKGKAYFWLWIPRIGLVCALFMCLLPQIHLYISLLPVETTIHSGQPQDIQMVESIVKEKLPQDIPCKEIVLSRPNSLCYIASGYIFFHDTVDPEYEEESRLLLLSKEEGSAEKTGIRFLSISIDEQANTWMNAAGTNTNTIKYVLSTLICVFVGIALVFPYRLITRIMKMSGKTLP